jgi:hypothetical protein
MQEALHLQRLPGGPDSDARRLYVGNLLIDPFLAWAAARGVAPDQLATYRQAAQLVLAEAAGSRVWPRHVDQAVRKQEAAGADVQTLATLHKVGDALLQYQTETAPAPPVAPPRAPAAQPAIVRANAHVMPAPPVVQAEPGFAPPVADINAPTGTGDYTEAARALGHYVTALLVFIGGAVVFFIAVFGMAISRIDATAGRVDPTFVGSAAIFMMIFQLGIIAWQSWALFSYARHAPGITDSAGSAKTAAVLNIVTGAISVLSNLTGSSTGGARGGMTLLGFLNLILGLISVLLVVSICRKIGSAFNDSRLAARAGTTNTLIGLSIGGFFLLLLMGFMGAGMLAVLIFLAVIGVMIAAFVLYIIILYGAKRVLTYAPRA